jgi:aryl-alcohol dehydrogenase-like predicted oxidoreductase
MQIAGRGIVATMFPAPPQTQVDEIIKAALDGGITWFDTAEMYGHGGSERALSNGLVHAGIKPGDVTVATKWAPFRADREEHRAHDRRPPRCTGSVPRRSSSDSHGFRQLLLNT